MGSRIFGSGIKRREDPRLITGKAKYTGDLSLPGMLEMAIVRSPHAHARIKSIDTSAAEAVDGVVAVFTGADLEGLGSVPCAWLIPGSDLKTPEHPALARDKVRYVGDGVAIVIAENRYIAQDAAELVRVDYEPLGAVVNPEEATADGAPQLHDDVPNNIAFRWVVSSGDDGVEQAFKDADAVVEERIVQQRLIPSAMEPRAALAQWNAATEEVTIWNTSQNPHIARFLLSGMTGVPEHKLRVIAVEVGGGFGSKIPVYPDEALTIWASMKLNAPVKWVETRSENYQVTIHGRDHIEYVQLAAKNGKVTAIKGTVYAGLGGYLSTASPGIPTILHGLMYSGSYDIPNLYGEVYGVFTTTTPTDAYRGAGRPEATFLVERLMEKMANELGIDPVEFRRNNLIPKFEDGHTVAAGIIYDSGDYETTMNKALDMIDYDAFRREQEDARRNGRYLGIGVTPYAEICGLGPSQVAGAVGFQGGLWESAIVRVTPGGRVQAMIGASPHGQGEETTFAQIISSELGFAVEDIDIIHSDTALTPMGWGSYGSRTTPVGGAALAMASRKIKEKARAMTAHLLEASVEDIEYDDGKFFVKGSPGNAKTIQEATLMATVAWDLPEGMDPGMEESSFYDPPNFVYPFGTHVAIVEVLPETGEIKLLRYVAVDDCGPQINPMIVAGQVHGGIVQGAGQALCEGAIYDDNGQLITGSMMDYTMPRADMFPKFELDHTVTPSPHHPIGVKGIGETGTIASTAAIYNAVMDALKPFGVEQVQMPLTSYRIWNAIHNGVE